MAELYCLQVCFHCSLRFCCLRTPLLLSVLHKSGLLVVLHKPDLLVLLPHKPARRRCEQEISTEAYLQRVLPLGFFSAVTLALGNVAYLYLDVGLMQA